MSRGVVTLGEARPPSLGQIRTQRRHLTVLLLIVFVLVAGTLVLVSIFSEEVLDRPVELLDPMVLGIGFFALSVTFATYFLLRERALARTERALIDESVLTAALRNRLHDLSVLSEAGKAVNSVLSLDDVLDLVLSSAGELLHATEASIMLLDQDRNILRIAASVGIDRSIAEEALVGVGEGVAGWVAESMEPIVLRGEVDDPRFRGIVSKDRQVRSAMSVPLEAGGEMLGVLNLSVTEGGREYTEHDLRALTHFAEQAALAISNARQYEREKEAKDALAEADRQRRDFLATLAHDLKTPLTSILGYVQLLQRTDDSIAPGEARKFIDVIQRQGERILAMVEQLVEVTKLEEGAPALSREPLDLREIANDQILGIRGTAGQRRVELHAPDDISVPYGDRSAVEHIMSNLLENAVKYTPDGSRISVVLENANNHASVSIVDDGPGIAPEELPHIFDRYRRGNTTGKGVGLGLFIVRNLVQAHGGRVWAENNQAGGARITFTLPLRTGR